MSKQIYTLEDYLKAPKERRENKWGWYKEPDGYLWSGNFDDFDDFDCESNKFDRYWKKHYPIQFFLRETFSNIKMFFGIKIRKIDMFFSNLFFPKQRWLKVPKEWCDKTELVPNLLFQIIINFVEEEDGLNSRNWYYECEDGQVIDDTDKKKELERAYRYAKYVRNKLDKRSIKAHYKFYIYYSNLMSKCDKHYCHIIVKNLDFLWT